ncbi:uncharacterized protein NPIL_364101 [Nephila pilipes]|uniref:Uncharacterized protein n=1 Tax=Nephila pilipes TaxID=299642 RepID=A0A8X6NV72_NEPPI|nr:uncharacterized protein NPIL_364101 [Nephila pilipes]
MGLLHDLWAKEENNPLPSKKKDGYKTFFFSKEKVTGMMRYSMAQCMPMGQVEDYCRDDNPPENRTLFYPNGEPVEVVDIYTHVCPCDENLQCVDNFCAADESYENNYLY